MSESSHHEPADATPQGAAVRVPYGDGVEQVQPNEERLIAETVASMARVSQVMFDRYRHGLRDVHAKSHGILRGELRVHDGLPEHLAQGLFATPRTYPIIIRFSSAPGTIGDDREGAPAYGVAIKVIGAHGERALEDDAITQDFLLVNSPTIPFGTVAAYHKLQLELEKQTDASQLRNQIVSGGAAVVATVLAVTSE